MVCALKAIDPESMAWPLQERLGLGITPGPVGARDEPPPPDRRPPDRRPPDHPREKLR
jgi:hypothetical protein